MSPRNFGLTDKNFNCRKRNKQKETRSIHTFCGVNDFEQDDGIGKIVSKSSQLSRREPEGVQRYAERRSLAIAKGKKKIFCQKYFQPQKKKQEVFIPFAV